MDHGGGGSRPSCPRSSLNPLASPVATTMQRATAGAGAEGATSDRRATRGGPVPRGGRVAVRSPVEHGPPAAADARAARSRGRRRGGRGGGRPTGAPGRGGCRVSTGRGDAPVPETGGRRPALAERAARRKCARRRPTGRGHRPRAVRWARRGPRGANRWTSPPAPPCGGRRTPPIILRRAQRGRAIGCHLPSMGCATDRSGPVATSSPSTSRPRTSHSICGRGLELGRAGRVADWKDPFFRI